MKKRWRLFSRRKQRIPNDRQNSRQLLKRARRQGRHFFDKKAYNIERTCKEQHDMYRIIAFAVFWIAIGMLLMLSFRFRIFGVLFALLLLVVSYWLMCQDD